MKRLDSPALRLALRIICYAAILVAASVVSRVTGAVAAGFVYQGF